MKKILYPERGIWKSILQRPADDDSVFLKSAICDVLKEIEKDGDKAVLKFTEKYDKVKLKELVVSQAEINKSSQKVKKELKAAIEIARKNIEKFHKHQTQKTTIIETMPGVKCWQKSTPIDKVGLYIPGGTAPLFSTVLMLGIPAKLAGCKEIVLCTPPNEKGNVNPIILYTAKLIGITRIFKIGGIQAIGAMAFGTESVPKVFKIFGPGNKYVTIAKHLVLTMDVAIDMPAGPSELAVIADATSNPAYVAADLLSQAEHGEDSQVLLVTTDETILNNIDNEIKLQIKKLPRRKIAAKALSNSKMIVLKNEGQLIDLVNEYAPEHLIINTKDYQKLSDKIVNAGSVFLGPYASESAGDYASGPNHTLPTSGSAKVFSGVSVASFSKKITFQELNKEGMMNIGASVEILAEAEKLFAHKNAVTIRLQDIQNSSKI